MISFWYKKYMETPALHMGSPSANNTNTSSLEPSTRIARLWCIFLTLSRSHFTPYCWSHGCIYIIIYIISEETSIFAQQRLPFYKALGVAACTVGKVRASTVFMCVCSTFRSSDLLLFVKNGFVVGVRTLTVTAAH